MRRIIPAVSPQILYAEHVDGCGVELFRRVCEADLEGVVAKLASAPCALADERSPWVKIKNPGYSQAEGRWEVFQARHTSASASA